MNSVAKAAKTVSLAAHAAYEQARQAKDARFDGKFFIAVKTTGIYCRPVCPVKPPKSCNVVFYDTAAAEAGFRPCLRCRPESSPGTPAWAGTSATVTRGLRLISDGALDYGSVEALSDRLGVNPRHLSRLFLQHLGASPKAIAQTRRLHFAKKLLDETDLPMTEIALSAGPGAIVLGWTSLLLAVVFLGGFYALYRLGMGQIRLARQQQDFVSAVSHELKTPLTSIRMYGEMLKEGWAEEGKRQQYYEYIHDEAERLTRLIENILQLASITRNGPRINLRPFAPSEVLDQVRAKISHPIERAGFELTVAIDEDTRKVEVLLDEDCFVQIVINLVDNAIKFSRTASTRRIDIRAVAERGGRVRFSVRDYGPGIPRDQMKKIFRLFYRTESELTRETVGTGIGLAIVHQLATAMSGKVDVLNRDPGAEFGVSFPAQR